MKPPKIDQILHPGWLEGRWLEKPGERRRRVYKLTRDGRRVLAKQRSGWEAFVRAITQVVGGEHA